MAEARRPNFRPEVANTQAGLAEKLRTSPAGGEISRLLDLRDIEQEFGLSHYIVYKAAREGKLHCLQRDRRGRKYYAEWEVRELLRLLYDLGVAA